MSPSISSVSNRLSISNTTVVAVSHAENSSSSSSSPSGKNVSTKAKASGPSINKSADAERACASTNPKAAGVSKVKSERDDKNPKTGGEAWPYLLPPRLDPEVLKDQVSAK